MTTRDDDPVAIAYRDNYVIAQYTWVQMFTEHLSDCSRVFKGDLKSMLILAIIGQSFLAEMLKNGFNDAENVPLLDNVSINASSLSDVLGIPRETVRRKLEDLAEKGWIERHDNGWRIVVDDQGSPARRNLAGLDQRSMKRISRLVKSFNTLADQSSLADPSQPVKNGVERNGKAPAAQN
jgi:hypothetical protein